MANTLASLEAALDRAVAAAVDAQATRDEARRRAGCRSRRLRFSPLRK
jgi:hypothetical protein